MIAQGPQTFLLFSSLFFVILERLGGNVFLIFKNSKILLILVFVIFSDFMKIINQLMLINHSLFEKEVRKSIGSADRVPPSLKSDSTRRLQTQAARQTVVNDVPGRSRVSSVPCGVICGPRRVRMMASANVCSRWSLLHCRHARPLQGSHVRSSQHHNS